MASISVKSERVSDGMVVSAHVKDWDLMQSFPRAIAQDIIDGLVQRFLQEHGAEMLALVKDPEFVAVACAKELHFRLKVFIDEKKQIG